MISNINQSHTDTTASKQPGAAPPILGYGALNGILFATYNRTLHLLSSIPAPDIISSSSAAAPGWHTFLAGAIGGLATFVVSTPTELVKCRAQVQTIDGEGRNERKKPMAQSSWGIAKQLWVERGGLRGWYVGGGVTSVRDAVGYGF